MSITIRTMKEEDRAAVLAMMRVFYASPAVWSNGSEEIFIRDIEYCVGDSPYLEGYVFESRRNPSAGETFCDETTEIAGYAMVAKGFSTEFGKPCIWIEDLYLIPKFRGSGIGSQFFDFIETRYTDVVFRLEVEEENERAVALYRKRGYQVLPYMEMKKER